MISRKRPGGELTRRPLHIIWIADCSGTMSVDGKIQALNTAIREAIPHMRGVARENPYAEVFVRAVKFSHGAVWHIRQPVSIASIEWMDIIADPLHTSRINADIMFMVDTSGSMGNEIEAVKASCRAFADRIAEKGATVRLGLVGFDIGGHRGRKASEYEVYKLSSYTIGIWPLSSPAEFKRDIASLKLGLFGGEGCYLANQDSTDIFPRVVRAFNGPPENHRILIIISDEIGNTKGLDSIVSQLNAASIQTHVLGVSGKSGAHESIAAKTGGKFWDIEKCEGVHDFRDLLEIVATTIAQEVTKRLSDGTTSGGTDMGVALRMVADELKIPPMTDRALPPVLVLISDGKPTDDFNSGLTTLSDQPWGKKAVRVAIAIGRDADQAVLQKFIGNPELKPLQADNPEALVGFIKWVSTAVVKSASSPVVQPGSLSYPHLRDPTPALPDLDKGRKTPDVW